MKYLNEVKDLKDMSLKKENVFFLILIIILFSVDRISKIKVISEFNEHSYFINNFLNIDLIWNIGVGFGLFSTDNSLIYNFLSFFIFIVITVLFYIFIKSSNLDKLIYAIIIGGALGNFYDRLVFKGVPDFIDFHYNNFHWFTFNAADIFISIGIIIFIIRSFFLKN
jgi:signal peptidase II